MCLEFESSLDFIHDVGWVLQLLDFSFSEDLLDNVGNTIGSQNAWQWKENFVADSVFTLERWKVLLTIFQIEHVLS